MARRQRRANWLLSALVVLGFQARATLAAAESAAPKRDTGRTQPVAANAARSAPGANTTLEHAPSPTRRTLAIVTSVVPGLLVHGAGSWALGEPEPALRLLSYEGLGFGLFATGGTTIVLSGAARSLVGPAAAVTALGAGLFATSWLLDVYHVSMPRELRGQERGTRDGVRSHVELVLIDSPQFQYGPMLRHGVTARWSRLAVGYQADHAPEGRFDQLRLQVGALLWQPASARSGSSLEARTALLSSEHLDEDFRSRGLEASVRLRLDATDLSKAVRGAFTEFEVGTVAQTTEWLATAQAPTATSTETLLLARSAFGIYLGDPWQRGGELQLYYDHRHDGLAEGLLATGLGSGVLGHFGISGDYFLTQQWGVLALAEVGSAAIVSLGLQWRSER
jgi:hypothetical protein